MLSLEQEEEKVGSLRRLANRVSDFAGYVVPLVTSIPPLYVWSGLMAIPFIAYITFMLMYPGTIPWAIVDLLVADFASSILTIGGFALIIYSAVYLHFKKRQGLVTSGPYRFLRHPQYSGMLLVTAAFTQRAYVISSITDGMQWIEPSLMLLTWYGMLFIYVILALVEESYLRRTFGEDFKDYRWRSGFFTPSVGPVILDIIVSVLLFVAMFHGLIAIGFLEAFWP